ncbi:tRNA (32-2'-O)-methyltransferase regulator THADA-like isoform X3 [Ascaphus truei]
MGECNSSGSVQKLQKILSTLSEIRPQLVAQEVEASLSDLVRSQEVLQLTDLQTVCMSLEGSSAAREYFRQHLLSLLTRASMTFPAMLQEQTPQSAELGYLTVKLCLQLFRELPENIAALVWTPALGANPLQRILGSLVQVLTAQSAGRDTRLLAGSALASLANTAPFPEPGARAGVSLIQRAREGPGEVIFGELCVPAPGPPLDGVGVLALVRGLLTCSRPDLLTCDLSIPSQRRSLLDILLPPVASLCEDPAHSKCSFQVLCLWLQRIREQISGILRIRGTWLLSEDGDTVRHVTQLLWSGAEMAVEGLSSLVSSCFQHFLHIHRTECQLLGLAEGPLLQDMLQRITETSWQTKPRYTPLCALLPFLGSERVLRLYPQLPAHLFLCLSTNYLYPPASETYRTLLTQQREEWSREGPLDEEKLAERWAVTWLTPLCEALSSADRSLQSNAAAHLLPATLRGFPQSSALLAQRLGGASPSQLHGWVSLLHGLKLAGRVAGHGAERLRLCLDCANDGVRLSALSFLCCSPRSSLALSPRELALLREFLPYNLGCDSPGFRQQLQASLRKALERLRDGALAALRRGRSQEEVLSQAVDFAEWLLQLSVSSLSPAGNYQRRRSGLLTLCSVLETYTDCWTPHRKKGQPPQDASALLSWARQRGCWDFFSAPNMQALLGCVQDSTNEIREMASDLLVRFFPPAPEPLALALFELGLASLCSPRVPEAEAGALLMKTLLQRPDGAVLFPGDAPLTALRFVARLTETLQDQYRSARGNMLRAATSQPLHGVLRALRVCLLEVPAVSLSISRADLTPRWSRLLQDLVSSLREMASFILSVLYGTQGAEPPVAPAPSLADMGMAVGALIAQGRGLEEAQGAVLLSEEHSLIMTCCWVSLKEIGELLGPLVEKLMSVRLPPGAAPLLPLSAVQQSAATYQDIFLRCRHWGAVDGCSAGFTRLCTTLLHHEDSKLRDLPRDMMDQALALSRSQCALSVTRRAAGFPVLLVCVLCAEGPQRPLLASCVRSLQALAQEPLPPNWDQTRDLPQVSAVHALQTMLRSAGLRSALLTHAVPVMSLTLRALRSPCWAMRNAALQLFSALTGGMLGLSRSEGALQSALPVGVLLRRFPGLRDVLLQELRGGETLAGRFQLHPSLHPPLTLLAILQSGGDSEASCLLEPLLALAGNPIYAVRVMAARTLVPVVPVTDYHTLLLRLVGELPHENEEVSHNALHGRLLQIQALLVPALRDECLPVGVVQQVAQLLLALLWLLTPAQRCPLVRAAFLGVLSTLAPSCGKDFASRVREAAGTELSAQERGVQVGSAVFHEACVLYLCSEAARSSDPGVHAGLCQLLQERHVSALRWLCERQEGEMSPALGEAARGTLQDMLCSVLLSAGPSEGLRLFLEAYVHMHRLWPPLPGLPAAKSQDLQSVQILLNLLESSRGGPRFQGHTLCTLSLLLAHGPLLEDISLVSRWLSALSSCADPTVSCEELRLAAAQALQLAGSGLVRGALGGGSPDLKPLAVRAVVLGVDLLQDEDRAVRGAAARFAVGALDLPGEVTLQSDRALLRLLRLLTDEFWSYEETLTALLLRLPPCDLYAALCTLQDRSCSLYEQDEPNAFADHLFISSLLLPLLGALLDSMCYSALLCPAVLQWVARTATLLREQIQRCQHWGREQGAVSPLWLRASGSPRVHAAVLGLLIRGELLLGALETLSSSGVQIADLGFPAGGLREELGELRGELRLHGLGTFGVGTLGVGTTV